jgi:hypothetical protein
MAVRANFLVLPFPKPFNQQTPAEALANLRYMEKHIRHRIGELERKGEELPARLEDELALQRRMLEQAMHVIAYIETMEAQKVIH